MKTWTFVIHGGGSFELKVNDRFGPALEHDGKMTVWKMVGTEEEALSVESIVKGPLIGAKVKRYTEHENDEMQAERSGLLFSTEGN